MSFVIMDHDDHEALLGLDWFGLTGAMLCPAEKMLRFPSQKIFLDGGENEDESKIDEEIMVVT